MKVSVSLGKAGFTPASCMKIGSDLTRIEDALIFAQFYVKTPGIKIGKNELSHISAGVHSSGGYARVVSHRADVSTKSLLEDYRKSAETANKFIRRKLEKSEISDADRKAVVSRLEKLHGKVTEIWKKAEADCGKPRRVDPFARLYPKSASYTAKVRPSTVIRAKSIPRNVRYPKP